MFGRIREQISENPRRCRGFSPARECSQTLPRFSPSYEAMENMFYFFYKIIIFRLNKEKDDTEKRVCILYSQKRMSFWWYPCKASLQHWYFDWQFEQSKLQPALASCSVHLMLARLETVCGDNLTTSTICFCFTPDNHKAIIRSLFSSEV